jgi:hypothetical protein
MNELVPIPRDDVLQAIFKELRILREQHNMMARAVKAMHDEIESGISIKPPERDGTMKKSLYIAGQIALMILASVAVFFLILAVRPAAAANVWEESFAGCHVRVYDREHLAKHPDQTVTAMRISLSKITRPYKYFPRAHFDYRLEVKFRGDAATYSLDGLCHYRNDDLECDPGEDVESEFDRFSISRKKGYVLLGVKSLPLEAHGKHRTFTAGKDDDYFPLYKSACW